MSGLFVVAFYALSNFVLVALFVAVILSNFETKKNEVDKEQADAYDRLWKLVHRKCMGGGWAWGVDTPSHSNLGVPFLHQATDTDTRTPLNACACESGRLCPQQ